MKISVVIPTLNGGDRFREVLRKILDQRVESPFDVLCIDSGSTDGTPEFAASCGVSVKTIPPERFNHGLTRNLGIRETDGDLVVLTVQDALARDELWLASLTGTLAKDETLAGSYSRQYPRVDCNPIIKDRLMNWAASRPERVIQALPRDREFADLPPFEKLALIAFDNVSSCVRRQAWEQHPFPERNFGEDIAWGHAMITQGFKIVYEPSSVVIHSHNNSTWYEFKRVYADHQNLNQLIGLTTVPAFKHVFSNGRGAYMHYKGLLEKEIPQSWSRRRLMVRAFFHAYLENLAQYLGAQLHPRVKKKDGLAMALDRWLLRGV